MLAHAAPPGAAAAPEARPPETGDALARIVAANELRALERVVRDPELVALGKLLFHDPILSGNRDISCATCHLPEAASGDGLPLSIGVLSKGRGPQRTPPHGVKQVFHRHAAEIFNRGDPQWRTLFWDARVEVLPSGIVTPAGVFPQSVVRDLLTALAMFPVMPRDEMRGYPSESNEIARTHDMHFSEVWKRHMARLGGISEYREKFEAVYGEPIEKLHFIHAANALAAFIAEGFSLVDAPWDRYLRGDSGALNANQKAGALLFFGKARCAACHAGNLLTDQRVYNIGVPQIGLGSGLSGPYDLGRYFSIATPENRFAFRTPPLRNVMLTAPYMHNGAYATITDAVKHHFDPQAMATKYSTAGLPPWLQKLPPMGKRPVAEMMFDNLSPKLPVGVKLSDAELAQLLAFLDGLTDPSTRAKLDANVPLRVPSGLPVVGP